MRTESGSCEQTKCTLLQSVTSGTAAETATNSPPYGSEEDGIRIPRCRERFVGEWHAGSIERRAAHQLLLEPELDACAGRLKKKQGLIVLPILRDFKRRHWMSTNQLAFECSGEGENVLGDGDHLRPDAVPWEERDVVAPRGGGAPEGSHLPRAQRRGAGSPVGEG